MEKNKNSFVPWLGGTFVGIAICCAFWAGHEYWPGSHEATPSVNLANSSSSSSAHPVNPPSAFLLAENTIADIAKQTSDSVVNIDISRNITIADTPFHGAPFHNFEFFFGPGFGGMPNQKIPQKGSGSGVIFRSDGVILTNNHVVGDADEILVTLNDKRKFKGTVLGRDPFTDLAIVKIDAKDLPAAKIGTSKNIRPGDWAIAVGSPLGLDHSVTLGIISALGRNISGDGVQNSAELIQTDAAINPGNSGGPLLNIHGEVIGLNTAIRADGQNIGFAIPIDVAKEIASQLLASGTIEHPYLGIMMQELDDKLSKSLGVSSTTKGVAIAGLVPNSPAEQSGLAQWDIIEKVDGKPVLTAKDIQQIVRSHKPGESLSFLVFSDGQLKTLGVKIGKYPSKEESQ
jgi:S1-C subfamily serine protease